MVPASIFQEEIMNKLEHLAASVSALALLTTAASAAIPGPGAHVFSPEEIAQLPIQRDMNRQREFYVILRPEAAGAADAVQAYFRGFGIRTEYFPYTNSVKLWASYFQIERAANVNYVAGPDAITPLTINRKPSFADPVVQGAVLATTFKPGPIMKAWVITPSVPTTIPSTSGVVGLSPADYARIYGYENLYKAGIKGQGQIVDIAADFGYNPTWLAGFQSQFGLSPSPNVTVVGLSSRSSGEPNLDVQRVYGTAPGAAIRFFFNTSGNFGEFNKVLIDIANDQPKHPAAAFTMSYGLPELYLSRIGGSSLFTTMDLALSLITGSAQKVALFASAGDQGDLSISENQGTFDIGAPLGQADVVFPASDPHVLAVGGTNLVLTPQLTRKDEYAWSGSGTENIDGGSGGGISSVFRIPPWQKGVVGTFSQTFKNVPDVASVAAPNSPCLVFFGSLTFEGGTSAASPTWAGTVALLQQAYEKAHKGARMTNWPAYFYKNSAGLFTDITQGSNGRFVAGPGYDNVTGLGVPCLLHWPKPCVDGK
jgi:subtilase family serine protease